MTHRFRNLIVTPAVALGLLGFAGHADAATSYELGTDSSVDAYEDTNDGLTIYTDLDSNLDDVSFSLIDGGTHTFDFFDIWTDEGSVNDDDEEAKAITAFLDFTLPGAMVQVDGETVGVSKVFGLFQNGEVTWDGPVLVNHAGGMFEVSLSDATFNSGIGGLWGNDNCWGNGTTITATVRQISTGQVVPTPSAAGAGLVLMSLGLLRRRRAAA